VTVLLRGLMCVPVHRGRKASCWSTSSIDFIAGDFRRDLRLVDEVLMQKAERRGHSQEEEQSERRLDKSGFDSIDG
jgi:hypothetical protein